MSNNKQQSQGSDDLRRENQELKDLIAKKDAANETRKAMLSWLVGDMEFRKLPHFLWSMADLLTIGAMHQVLDYVKSVRDARDAGIVESYRSTMVEHIEVRDRKAVVKSESIEATKDPKVSEKTLETP